jgi:hypothetical protein
MALTVTSIEPAVGHSGGKTLVEIIGADFTQLPAPPAAGRVPTPAPTVRVLIGGKRATQVGLVSATQLYCMTPKGDPDGGPQDVVVQNLDEDGNVVETATLADAYTFQRPDLTQDSRAVTVLRYFIREVKRQVLANVNFSTHSDYDAATGDTLNIAYVQELPALVIGDFELPENRMASNATPVEYRLDADRFITKRPPTIVDMRFSLTGVTDGSMSILNLQEVVREFFKKNPFLEVPRGADEDDVVQYELMWSPEGTVSVTHNGSDSKTRNVESFIGAVQINNIAIEDMPGITSAAPDGVPAGVAHEGTTGFGWISRDDSDALVVEVVPKSVDDDEG